MNTCHRGFRNGGHFRCLASLADTVSSVINGLVCGPSGDLAVQVGDGSIHTVNFKALEGHFFLRMFVIYLNGPLGYPITGNLVQ